MNNFKRIVAVLMVLATLFAFAACQNTDGTTNGQNPGTTNSTTPSTKPTTQPTTQSKPVDEITFRVKVVDEEGAIVPGVWVQLCKESCVTKLSDAEGWASFTNAYEDGYKANIAWMDDEADEANYIYDPENVTYFEKDQKELTLVITKATFRVQVVDQEGNAVSGATVKITKGDKTFEAVSDGYGWAKYTCEIEDGYSAVVTAVEDADSYEFSSESVAFAAGEKGLTLTVTSK